MRCTYTFSPIWAQLSAETSGSLENNSLGGACVHNISWGREKLENWISHSSSVEHSELCKEEISSKNKFSFILMLFGTHAERTRTQRRHKKSTATRPKQQSILNGGIDGIFQHWWSEIFSSNSSIFLKAIYFFVKSIIISCLRLLNDSLMTKITG